jgi:hypothetical protein
MSGSGSIVSSVVSAQTSTTYAVASSDSGTVVQYTGSGAGAWTIPSAATLGKSFSVGIENRESGAVAYLTLTPTTSTINGAALVQIPYGYGINVFSDGANYTCNFYDWRNATQRQTIYALGAASGSINNSETICAQVLLPAGFLKQYDHIRIWVGMSKSGTTDTGLVGIRIGTGGTTSDTQIFTGSVLTAANVSYGQWFDLKVQSATSVRKEGFGGTGQASEGGGSSAAYATAVTISNVSNALYVSVTVNSSSTNNTVKLEDCIIEYLPVQ